METGIANLPLHGGKAPKWLYTRMVSLLIPFSKIAYEELGEEGLLKKISDPFWFQALGSLVGYDWHSSGLTTVLTAALKDAFRKAEIPIVVCGGKGKAAINTPNEISSINWDIDKERLIYSSRMVAKIDSALVQAGYQLYHHSMFISKEGSWAVVQQGMNPEFRLARRTHFFNVGNFILEPYSGLEGVPHENVLNMVSQNSLGAQKVIVELVNKKEELNHAIELIMPSHHIITGEDLSKRALKELIMLSNLNKSIANFEELASLKGVGPAAIRALALISELIYGEKPSYEDPVKFSFAHGGKDGTPYKVNRKQYDEDIAILTKIADKALGSETLKGLYKFVSKIKVV